MQRADARAAETQTHLASSGDLHSDLRRLADLSDCRDGRAQASDRRIGPLRGTSARFGGEIFCITCALLLLGVVWFVLAIAAEDGTFAFLGLLLLFAALIFGVVAARVTAPTKIDDRFVWLSGVNKEYLDQLPQWPGP